MGGAPPHTRLMTILSQKFGHEENFSRYLLESGQFEALLCRAGFNVAGKGDLELPVRYGHKGCEGRLDIHQPTTAGVVIGEMQYGVSDSNHRNRFAGYAKSVSNPAAIFWVAEGFRAKDLEAVSASKVPVICVQAKLVAGEVRLTAIGGARLSAQSLDRRVKKQNEEASKYLAEGCGGGYPGQPAIDVLADCFKEIAQSAVEYPDSWAALTPVADLVKSEIARGSLRFGKTEPSNRKRSELVLNSDYFRVWLDDNAEALECAWQNALVNAQARLDEQAAKNAEYEMLCEKRKQQEAVRRDQAERALANFRKAAKAQNDVPEIYEIKLQAENAYCEWYAKRVDYSEVQKLYVLADEACVAHGWKEVSGLPLPGNFLPEKFVGLAGYPRRLRELELIAA